jgi:hypothetical protein
MLNGNHSRLTLIVIDSPYTNTLLGSSFAFDMFYNERHTSASNLLFDTSLLLQCPWYDHCGVCQGNGQVLHTRVME